MEVGCGTAKNTPFLLTKADHLLGVDFSAEMLQKARAKISDPKAQFQQADITQPWRFTDQQFDLITFSLVLEHIQHLEPVFSQAAQKLRKGGWMYIGELHPFKQYAGSKARFETETGTTIVECYTHHLSDFVQAARQQGFHLLDLQEFFDGDDRSSLPRILGLLFTIT